MKKRPWGRRPQTPAAFEKAGETFTLLPHFVRRRQLTYFYRANLTTVKVFDQTFFKKFVGFGVKPQGLALDLKHLRKQRRRVAKRPGGTFCVGDPRRGPPVPTVQQSESS